MPINIARKARTTVSLSFGRQEGGQVELAANWTVLVAMGTTKKHCYAWLVEASSN